jgi:hypothetical protein
MCDYSLENVKTRPAEVGDTLTTRQFRSGTRGFAASEDKKVAVCLLPGTELAFTDEVRRLRLWPWSKNIIKHKAAIFRQINQHNPTHHHDAIEFPDGQIGSSDILGGRPARHGSAITGEGQLFNRIFRVRVHDALSLLIASETSEYLSLVSEAVVGIRAASR